MIQPCRMIRRLAGLACLKGSAMVKVIWGLLTLGLTAFLCGAAVHTVEQGAVSNLRLVVCDTDQSVSSQELIERLSGVTGLSVFVSEEADGRQRLLGEEAEGLLVIGEGYGLALEEGSRLPLSDIAYNTTHILYSFFVRIFSIAFTSVNMLHSPI